MDSDLQGGIVDRMERLNEAISQQRKLDDQVRSLKAEVATLTTKMAVGSSELGTSEFTALVGRYLDSW